MSASLSELDPAILAELDRQFTSLDEPVYFATAGADPLMVATAMARLSRSPNDLRLIMGKEFLQDDGKDPSVVRQNIFFKYGDDSVAQLYTMQGVVEGASNLLTKILEWGRLGSYLEQSTRYLVFDRRDENGKFPFYTPVELGDEDTRFFETQTEEIFVRYSQAVRAMQDYLGEILEKSPELKPGEWISTLRAQACDAARVLLPVSVKATVGIVGSAQSFENLLLRLRASDLREARLVGNLMLQHARVIAPDYMRRVDLPDRGNMASAYLLDQRQRMSEWATELGINGEPVTRDNVKLYDFTPKDELEVVKYVLFDASDISLDGIEKILSQRSDAEIRSILKDYIGDRHNRRHKPGRAFEHPHYTWEYVTDYGIFRDLQRHRMVDDLRWQKLTPYHGHVEIPELAIQSGVAHLFNEAFDISSGLYEHLKQRYGTTVAQYGTLLGHNMRWMMTINAREAYHIHELRTSSQGHPGYRKVVNEMHRQLGQVHPTIAEGMVHVDHGENPDLARLQEALRNARKARESGLQ
ncbi:FAD-dependent thymidylate synthase [Candidatus Saccharibacteria bacterium]|nr:FAD-dependent thymidylate synthase [Candidatus Saccharibacteria bacterium]